MVYIIERWAGTWIKYHKNGVQERNTRRTILLWACVLSVAGACYTQEESADIRPDSAATSADSAVIADSPAVEIPDTSATADSTAPAPAPVNEASAAGPAADTTVSSAPGPLPSTPSAPQKPALSVRQQRMIAASPEFSRNGVTGIGVLLHLYPLPRIGIDFGGGLSQTGLKGGGRMRYLFRRNDISPCVGIGYSRARGRAPMDFNADSLEEPLRIKIHRSHFVQLCAGADMMSDEGLFLMIVSGYSFLLNDDNVEYLSKNKAPTESQEQAIKSSFKGGFMIALNLGYSLKVR
jgi:hypothetical protein